MTQICLQRSPVSSWGHEGRSVRVACHRGHCHVARHLHQSLPESHVLREIMAEREQAASWPNYRSGGHHGVTESEGGEKQAGEMEEWVERRRGTTKRGSMRGREGRKAERRRRGKRGREKGSESAAKQRRRGRKRIR